MEGRVVWVVSMPIKIDADLRDIIHKTKGSKRGNLRDSVQEAMEDWILKKTQELVQNGSIKR